MTNLVRTSAFVAAALWVGLLFTVGFVVAPYLFALAARHGPAVPNTGVAADLIGPLLSAADVASLLVGTGLVLAVIFLRRSGALPLGGRLYLCELGLLAAIGCAGVNYWALAPRIKALREQLAAQFGAFHLADRADPLYLQFGRLHQASTVLFVLGFAAALVCLVCLSWSRSAPVATRPSAP